MGSSDGVEIKQKQNGSIPQHINHVSLPLLTGSSVAGVSRSQPTGANRGMHRPGPVAVIQVGGEEPCLVRNTVSINCGG